MRVVCPDCLGTLVPNGTDTVRCETHGGEYRLLFARAGLFGAALTASDPLPAPADPQALAREPGSTPAVLEGPPEEAVSYAFVPGTLCAKHPEVEAEFACCRCGTPICNTCAFPTGDGQALCPDCAIRANSGPATAGVAELPPILSAIPAELPPVLPAIPPGAHCVQHPKAAAVQQCRACGAFVCATCDFSLPGNVHVCPACAAAPKSSLSPKRKKLLISSFALAVWSTLGMTALLAGVFAVRSQVQQEAIGTLLMFFVLFPAVVGLGLGLGARDRRLANPPSIGIAIAWNALLAGSFILLRIISLASG